MIADGISSRSYTATGLSFGTTYEFKIEARNSYSISSLSDILELYCAFKPEPPTTLVTSNSNDVVVLTWNEPITNGSPITSYEVFVRD